MQSNTRGFLEGCQNPAGCRKIAVKRIQAGMMDEVVSVTHDMELCAYCAATFEDRYRDAHPDGFVREVPSDD